MYAAVRHFFDSWLFQLRGPQTGPVVLVQRRVFILPTPQGWLFAGVLLLMLVGSINYGLSLGFVLTFLLAALGLNGMVYTFRNLAHLSVSAERTQAIFVGGTAAFRIRLHNPGAADRFAVGLSTRAGAGPYVDVPAGQSAVAILGVPALRRGRLRPGRFTLFTRFPLGLYRAWSYVEFDLHCLVYPRPAAPGLPLPAPEAAAEGGGHRGAGREDFSGLRQYRHGDSPRHIAWKAAARTQDLLTKQFAGRVESELWLDWQQLPSKLGVEDRLSQLTRWVLDADAGGAAFGLRIPGDTISPATGLAHRDRCLKALALHGLDDDAPSNGG
jgi:uncharacterized protein (DUF58 family)